MLLGFAAIAVIDDMCQVLTMLETVEAKKTFHAIGLPVDQIFEAAKTALAAEGGTEHRDLAISKCCFLACAFTHVVYT